MHTLVDDPIYITRGDEDTKILALSRALLWAVVAGFPLAWHKSDGGKSVAWIGACISATPSKVVVTIPEDKIQATIDSLKKLRRQNPVQLKPLNQAAGRVMFIAHLIPVLKPFLYSFWKAIGDINRAGCAAAAKIKPKQMKHDILWLLAFLNQWAGELARSFPLGSAVSITSESPRTPAPGGSVASSSSGPPG
jgi:hypothetical protein